MTNEDADRIMDEALRNVGPYAREELHATAAVVQAHNLGRIASAMEDKRMPGGLARDVLEILSQDYHEWRKAAEGTFRDEPQLLAMLGEDNPIAEDVAHRGKVLEKFAEYVGLPVPTLEDES